MTEPTPEQKALGLLCIHHTDQIMAMTSRGDAEGAYEYLAHVQKTDGREMAENVINLMVVRLPILPPDML